MFISGFVFLQDCYGRSPGYVMGTRCGYKILCNTKYKTSTSSLCSKSFLFRLGLLDDLLQQIDITGESLLAGSGQ